MPNNGFSLIELMIVLAITSILLCFSYPSYQDYLLRTHRLDGQMALLALANQMELYFAQFGSYTLATIGHGTEHDVLSSSLTPEGWYDLSIVSATEQHFMLQATPRRSQDHLCQSLRLSDQGIQTIASGPGGAPTGRWTDCWP